MFQEESIGAFNFNVLRGILEAFEFIKLGRGAEIGVLDGGTSWYLLSSFPQLRLVTVDPYLAYEEYDQARMNAAEATAYERLLPFGDRWVKMKEPSHSAAAKIPDGSLDFVFIDGDHTYEAVRADLASWYPKVRPGGLFSGHDYRWPEVARAVGEFAAVRELRGHYSPKESDVWWLATPARS